MGPPKGINPTSRHAMSRLSIIELRFFSFGMNKSKVVKKFNDLLYSSAPSVVMIGKKCNKTGHWTAVSETSCL